MRAAKHFSVRTKSEPQTRYSTVYVILPWKLRVTSDRVISFARAKAACKLNIFQFKAASRRKHCFRRRFCAPREISFVLKFPAV